MIKIQTIASSSAGNCYKITDGTTSLLLECGIPIAKIKQALNFKLNTVSGCLVTHYHNDHVKAGSDIVRAGIDLYCTRETATAKRLTGHRVHHVTPQKQFVVKSWTIIPFATVHDAEGSVGYLLANSAGEKLLFLTDSSYCKYKFDGLTYMLIECNFSQGILDHNTEAGVVSAGMRKRVMESHFSLERLLDLLHSNDISKLQEIHLLHLSSHNSDEEMFKSEIQRATGVPVTVAQE